MRDGVQGAVEGPVAAAVEPVPDGVAAAGREGAGAGRGRRTRPRCGSGRGGRSDTMAWAALTGPMPQRSVRPGAMSSTMASSWARLSPELRRALDAWPGRGGGSRRWRTACSRLAPVGARGGGPGAVRARCRSACRGRGRGRCRRRPAAGRAAGWSGRCWSVVSSWRATSRMRRASRSPSARGVGSRVGVQAAARPAPPGAASIGSDLPRPRRPCGPGCSHSITGSPAAASARASPIP